MATDEELLTAYVDGVGELSPDERRRVEQTLTSAPELRAEADAIRDVLAKSRAIVPSTNEPDWSALERQIRETVGPVVPLPWWRRTRWLAPVGALVTTAAIALVWLHHVPADHAFTPRDAGTLALAVPTAPSVAAEPPAPAPAPTTMYIDGQVIDLGNVDPEKLLIDDADPDDTADGDGLLPVTDYGWVDGLDDKAMERAERWLARKKG